MNPHRKPTKTISGVAPLAVMLPPRQCPHGACLYCPTLKAPQSYTPESPAVLRARECNYDAKKQVKVRLDSFKAMGHPTDKIELIIMGGTFLSYPEKFQNQFIKDCYDALNKKKSGSLKQAKKINQTSKHRCTALCIETRPDFCSTKHIADMLNWGGTRVELGVQAIDDKIYKKVNRGHTVQDVIAATKRLKQAGFKIGYHLMPGIPGSNPKKDIQMFKKIFFDKNFKPDQIKIYPCQVLKGAGIEELYYNKEYLPYTKEQAKGLIIKMIKLTPRYCRIMRVMREIPPSYLVAGILNIDLRKDIEDKIRKNKLKINEIRFREIGFAIRDKRKIDPKIKIKITKYKASGGTEFFVEAINKDNILFGLLRLRLDKNTATIRELHVYGPALNLSEKRIVADKPKLKSKDFHENENFDVVQHKGLGKELIKQAEKITKTNHYKTLRIISGVGVRQYYQTLGYTLDKEGIYMEKDI